MKRKTLLYLVTLLTFSCSNDRFIDPELKFIVERYPLIQFENPHKISIDSTMFGNSDSISIFYADTLDGYKAAGLRLYYHKESDSLSFYQYFQHWVEGDYNHYIAISKDTVNHYKRNLYTKERYYWVGKYSYITFHKYYETPLDIDWFIYYQLHEDSLVCVRGNEVPPLPKPDSDEVDIWYKKHYNEERNWQLRDRFDEVYGCEFKE